MWRTCIVPSVSAVPRSAASMWSRSRSDGRMDRRSLTKPSRSTGGRMPPLFKAAGVTAAVVVTASFAAWRYVESLGPLDLSVAERRSTIVTDQNGQLLRPFATDGRWRLPIVPVDVDPRFLAMLRAYEDARFERHAGIDLSALARAGAQFAYH